MGESSEPCPRCRALEARVAELERRLAEGRATGAGEADRPGAVHAEGAAAARARLGRGLGACGRRRSAGSG